MSELYSDRLKELARAATGAGTPQGGVILDNPLCGDRVELAVTVADGVVTGLSHRVRGCLLCQAAAAAAAQVAPGMAVTDAAGLAEAMRHMLSGGPPPFPEAQPFQPAVPHRGRHGCVILPFDALSAALK